MRRTLFLSLRFCRIPNKIVGLPPRRLFVSPVFPSKPHEFRWHGGCLVKLH